MQSTQCPAIHTKAVVEKKQKILALMGSQQVVLGNPKNLLFLFNAFSWTANSVCVNRISIQREKESTALFVQAKKNYTERLESRETPLNWMARRGSLSFRLVLTVPPTKGGSYVITVPLLIIILRAYLLIFLLRLFPKFSMSKQLEKYRELSLSHLFVPILPLKTAADGKRTRLKTKKKESTPEEKNANDVCVLFFFCVWSFFFRRSKDVKPTSIVGVCLELEKPLTQFIVHLTHTQ